MERKRLVIDVVLVSGIVFASAAAWSQSAALRRIEEDVAKMGARVSSIEQGRPAVARAAGEVQDELPRSPDDQAEVVAVVPRMPHAEVARATHRPAEPAAFDPQDPEVRGQLREVIAEEQEALQEERWQQRSERREERLRKQVSDLAASTDMDGILTEQLTDLLVVEQAEASDVFRQAREDFSWDEAREKVTTLRAETDAKAKALLEDDQYEEYQKMREEESSRWGRGPGPRPAPDGRAQGRNSGPRVAR